MSEKLRHQLTVIEKYLKTPGNKLCADCKRPSPTWASINLGVFVCIKCSGCHREIGVHVTKIKSINLDLWPPGVLSNFGKLNNAIANEYWECHLKKDFDFEAIRNNDYRLQDFIRDKYERKRYINSKKEDPMSLVIQGHDLIKEYALRKESNTVEEEEEDEPRERHFVRPKAGRSFGIVSKPEDKNNIQKKTIANNNSNNNVQNNNPVQPSQTEKPKGFAFIKKKPSDKVTPSPTVLPANSIQQTQPPQQPELLSVSANNDTLIDLYNIESQTPEAVKKLNEQLNQAYSHPSQPIQSQIPINPLSSTNNYNIQNMNYPNININNFYSAPFTNNQKPFGYGYQTNPMMTPPMYQQPMGNPLYNIELYNDPKKDQSKVFNMNSQPVINMNYGSSQVKKDDPFKNLVSFN